MILEKDLDECLDFQKFLSCPFIQRGIQRGFREVQVCTPGVLIMNGARANE